MTSLKRILLVEDSPRDAELILDAFGSRISVANEIVHVRDGADALDYLYRRGEFAGRADEQPALMLLDLKLPKVDGLEVLRQIKSDPALKMTPGRDDDLVAAGTGSRPELSARSQRLRRQALEVPGVRESGETGRQVLGRAQPGARGPTAVTQLVAREPRLVQSEPSRKGMGTRRDPTSMLSDRRRQIADLSSAH